ncbi:MAG: PspA/IM30 family protein [Eubacterium sp.]|nr:PspA/IM30 family protein [Eubacterium sp.]
MASNINAVFKNEDKHPEKAIEKYLLQLRSDLGQVKSETAALEMDVRRAENALNQNRAEKEKLERYVAKAKESGSTSDAMTFESKLMNVTLEGEKLEAKYNEAKANLTNLSAMNEKLSNDLMTLEGKLQEVKTKVETAKAQEKMNQMAMKAGSADSDEMFSKMNEKADYMLDRANAMAELDSPTRVSDFDDITRLADKYENGDSDNDGSIDIE